MTNKMNSLEQATVCNNYSPCALQTFFKAFLRGARILCLPCWPKSPMWDLTLQSDLVVEHRVSAQRLLLLSLDLTMKGLNTS